MKRIANSRPLRNGAVSVRWLIAAPLSFSLAAIGLLTVLLWPAAAVARGTSAKAKLEK